MGGLFDDTITRMPPDPPPPMLQQALLRTVCRIRGHRWTTYGAPLRYGRREFCGCCDANRVLITTVDGDVLRTLEASAAQVCAGWVPFAEALYEARWGAAPVRRMRAGEWPAP